ncbi:putative reverse transcriptase domain-containing protein [Tanacetum coccineum]|uniref:Reverse transcriptase domain-containing protein n=1 Tax=Tanacetum coccineum TaxID=301880 RepID=A0ABQ4WHM9_9ASTR
MSTPTQFGALVMSVIEMCELNLEYDWERIMPPRMRTRSAGRTATESLKGGMGVWVGRGGRGGKPREGNDERVEDFNGQGNDQGLGANGGVEGVNGNVNARNVLVNGNRVGYSYKEFLACNLRNMMVKEIRTLSQEVVVSMSWNDFKFMMIEEFCPSHEMQKLKTELWNHAMVGACHAAYTDRFHELARRLRKKGNVGEPSKDKNGRDDNKRTRTGNAFATTANPIGRENTGTWPKCTTYNSYHAPGGPCRTCFNCNRPGHLVKDCRGVPRKLNPVNARNPTVRACYECGSTDHVRSACHRLNRVQGPEGNRPNQVAANNRGQGRGNQRNQARDREFMLGAEEARQDPNIVTGADTPYLLDGYRSY